MQLESTALFKDIERVQRSRGLPTICLIEITNRCNVNCRHCYVVEGRIEKSQRQELEPAEMESMLEQIKELGVFTLTFSGGEFFMHPHAYDYLQMATDKQFAIRIFSNLAKNEVDELDKLLNYNVFSVETSIHGADAETHDHFTQSTGSFDRTIASIKKLRELGIPVIVKTCWTKNNWHQSDQVMALCDELGVEFRGTTYIQSRQNGREDNLAERMTSEQVVQFYKHEEKSRTTAPDSSVGTDKSKILERNVCGAASKTFRIDPYGDVFPCVEVQVAAGNVRTTKLTEIWHHSDVLNTLRSLKVKDMDLGDDVDTLDSVGGCNLCPGANLKEKGKLNVVAEESKRLAKLRHVARTIDD